MGYSRDIYEAARDKLAVRREKSISDNEARKLSFYEICPRAQEIDSLLGSTLAKATRLVASGNGSAREIMEQARDENLRLQAELKELLVKHGLPENYLDDRYVCERCNDTGYVDGYMCDCFKELLQHEACDRLSSTTPMKLSTFDSFKLDYYDGTGGEESPKAKMSKVLAFCKSYADNFTTESKSLLMTGGTGLGKTHLSLAIADVVVRKGYGVAYDTVFNFASKLEKEHFSQSSENDTEALMQSCDLLILDDLGAEFRTSFTTAALFNIINTRLMAGKPTIISTNLTAEELRDDYSDRLVSRIFTSYTRIRFIGSDIRVIMRKNEKNT